MIVPFATLEEIVERCVKSVKERFSERYCIIVGNYSAGDGIKIRTNLVNALKNLNNYRIINLDATFYRRTEYLLDHIKKEKNKDPESLFIILDRLSEAENNEYLASISYSIDVGKCLGYVPLF